MNNQGNFPNMGMRPTMNQGQNMQQQQMLMMEQMLNSGNPNLMMNMFQGNMQSMNPQQRAMFMENFQRSYMMMQHQASLQTQGMVGNGNAGMLNMMQEAMRMQGNMMGAQQGLVGSGNSQRQNVQPALPHIQPSRVSNPAKAATVNRNPSVNTRNIKTQSSAVTSNSAHLGQSKPKGILKNPKSSSSGQSVNTSSQKQTQPKSSQHRDMLQTYFKQSGEAVSSVKGSVENQTSRTGTIPSTQTSSLLKTSPLQTHSVISKGQESRNVFKSTTSQQNPNVVTSSVISNITSQTKLSTVTRQSAQGSKVEGHSIPTLVSSGSRKQRDQHSKRKADVDIGTEIKKAKVIAEQAPASQPDIEEEDPEHVQAQVFISNIPNDTSKEMILEILLHYKFTAPKVWIGHHNSLKHKICAFVKLPSLKDSKRVIAEMKGFPYKGLEMEIRFSAAADFIDYNVPNSGLSQPQIPQQPPAGPVQVLDTSIPPPTVIHQQLVEQVPGTIPIDAIAYTAVPVPVYYPAPVGYGTAPSERTYIESDRRSADSGSPYPREYRRSVSPRGSHSPYESRDRHSSPGQSSRRRYSRSPEYSSQRRYSRSPDHSSQRRYSRSPEYSSQRRHSRSPSYDSRNPDYQSQRKDHSQSPYRRDRSPDTYHAYTPPRHRSGSPEYSENQRYGSPPDDLGRDRGTSEYPAHRVTRSSLSPDRGYRDSPHRARSPEARNLSETYIVHIENLPADVVDDELEFLLKSYVYDGVRLKVRDGRATADIYTTSSTEAKLMVRNLDGHRFIGLNLRVDWHREEESEQSSRRDTDVRSSDRDRSKGSPNRDRSPRSKRSPDRDRTPRSKRSQERDRSKRSLDRDRSSRSPDRERREPPRETKRSFADGKDKSLFQSFINASYPNAPVLGRKYIKEFSAEGSSTAFYLCILCEMYLSWKEIADHMMGYKHRLNCIKRSHPKIYDDICLVPNKVDMLGQCAKYALQLENTRERIARVYTQTPEHTASQHLKKMKADRVRDEEKRHRAREDENRDTKRDDKRSREEDKDAETPDSTSDIFKKIAAYKKKFEASKDTSVESGESPAKKPRTEDRKQSKMSFEDLAKQNKFLADSIQKEISSARKGASEKEGNKKSETNINEKVEQAKKQTEKKYQDDINKKVEEVKKKTELNSSKIQGPARGMQKVIPKATVDESKQKKLMPVKETTYRINEKKNVSESKVSVKEKVNEPSKDQEVIVIESDNEDSEKDKQVKSEKETNKTKGVRKDNNESKEKETNKSEDLTIDLEDIKDLGKSISAELFGEELGNMEDEDIVEEKAADVGVKAASAEGKMSNHPHSLLKKYFDVQLMKDPDNSGIIGLQYITEVIPGKGSKAHVFTCSLCDVKCARSTIVDHIIGYKHRMKYFEVHHFEIYSNIMTMDQSRKVLNAECIRCAKIVQQKEGLKTIMTLSEGEFKQKKKEVKQVSEEQMSGKKVDQEIKVEMKTGQKSESKAEKKIVQTSLPSVKKKPQIASVKDSEKEAKSATTKDTETVEKAEDIKEIIRFASAKAHTGVGKRLRAAKAAAKLVSHGEGRETVELYKYIQQKPDVPLLGLNNVTEIQGLYGAKCKPTYSCQLCFSHTKIDGTPSIYEHLTGIRHIESYLKKHFPHKMIHLKLITQNSAKTAYLHNQAKLLCQDQLKQPQSIYVVNIVQMEEEKKAMAMAQAAAKAVEEAEKAEAEALSSAKQATMTPADKAVKPKDTSTTEGVIDLTAEEVRYEPLVAQLYTKIAGLQDIPLVGLSYITEIQGIMADKVPPRYECKLCDSDLITANYINAHITGTDHRLRFLKANYPVFYSKAEGNRDLAEKFCREIEEQFGRESISVKKRIQVRPDGSVVYSDPSVVKAPVESKEAEKETEQDVMETIEEMDEINRAELEEGEKLGEDIYFYKIIEGLDCTPMLGLQYIKEVQHPSIDVPPMYECDVCNIKNGPYLNTKNILKHICSKDHRLRFMRENHIHLYKEITSLSTEVQQKFAIDKHTKEIESKVGRGSITKVKSDKSTYWCKSNLDAKLKEASQSGQAPVPIKETINEEDEKLVADEDQPQYKCKKCNMIVAKDRRKDHYISVHQNCYKCKLCRLSFPNHFYLQKHVNTHHDTSSVLPEKKIDHNFNMNKWFMWHAVMGRPLKTDKTGQVRLVCKQCHMVMKAEQMEEHFVCNHLKGYTCRLCKVSHGSNTALEKHLRFTHSITQTIPIENFKELQGMKLSKKFIQVHSTKPSEQVEQVETDPEEMAPSDQKEVQSDKRKGIKKFLCTRCFSLFMKQQLAESHYKASHFFDYPCSMCKYVFKAAAQLEQHYKYNHMVYRSVKTPVVPFEKCFDVITYDEKRMTLEEYLKQDPEMKIPELSHFTTFVDTPASAGTSVSNTATAVDATTAVKEAASTDVAIVPDTSIADTTSAVASTSVSAAAATSTQTSEASEESVTVSTKEQQEKVDQNKDDKVTEKTKSDSAWTKATSGPVDLDALLKAKEDEQFDWDTEYAKITERMQLGGITKTARKCKFMLHYNSTFSKYPLIGLQMITEFQQRDINVLPWYICELCKDRIMWSGITAHIVSIKHRIKYMERNHMGLHNMVTHRQFPSVESLAVKLESLAQSAVKKEGKQFSMTVMIELPPTESELKALAAKTKAVPGARRRGTAVQAVAVVNKDQACSGASASQQKTSKEEGNLEEPKKKLPTWVKIPRISAKVNQPYSTSVASPAKTKGYNNEKKAESRKETTSVQSKTSPSTDSNKKSVDRESRSGESSSRGSPSKEEGRRSHERRRTPQSESRSKRHEREASSYRRRRSRSRDKNTRDSKSPRSGHDCSARKSEKDSDKRSSKDSSRTRNSKQGYDSKDNDKTIPKKSTSVSVGVKPTDKIEIATSSQKLPEAVPTEVTEKTEHAINEDDFSLEELELIGKSIEEQMTEELILVDDEEIKSETKNIHEIDLTEDKAESEETSNECVIEINTDSDEDLEFRDEAIRQDEMVINVITEETEPIVQKLNHKPSDNCVVEITMVGSSPEKSAQPEKKSNDKLSEVNNTIDSPVIEINMNIEKNDFDQVKSLTNEEDLLKPCTKSKTGDNILTTDAQMDTSLTQNVEIKPSELHDKTLFQQENTQATDNGKEYDTEDKIEYKPSREEVLKDEDEITNNDEINLSHDDSTKQEIKTNAMIDTHENDNENDTDADFDAFITSELGEDFVTVDDFQDSSPDMATETELDSVSDSNGNNECLNKQDSAIQSVKTQNISKIVDKYELSHENEMPKVDGNKEIRMASKINSSVQRTTLLDRVSEKEAKFDENIDGGSSKLSSESHLSKSDEEHNSSIPNVCVVEVSMEPSTDTEKTSLSEFTDADGILEPYDDSEDMEFILTDDFVTIDESEDIDTELQASSTENNFKNATEVAVNDISKQSIQILPSAPEDKNSNTESVRCPEHKGIPVDTKLQLKDNAPLVKQQQASSTEKSSKKVTLKVALNDTDIQSAQIRTSLPDDKNSSTDSVNCPEQKEFPVDVKLQLKDNASMVKPHDRDVTSEEICDEVITSFPMDDDDDDIEEIFLGGDFVTVDTVEEVKEETTVSDKDTVEEECIDDDFFSEDFVTLDEVDADASADHIKVIEEGENSTNKTPYKHSSTNENRRSSRSSSKSTMSQERSVSRDGGRTSKDRLESKKSAHSSGSGLRDSKPQSSSKKGESSRASRHRSPEKTTKSHHTTKSSHQPPREASSSTRKYPGSSSSNRSGGRSSNREAAVLSMEIGSTDSTKKQSSTRPTGIEVNVQVLNKSTGSERTTRSVSIRSRDNLGSFTVKQDGKPRNIDTCSFLGISVSPTTESAKQKESGKAEHSEAKSATTDKNVKSDGNKKSNDMVKGSKDTKTNKSSAGPRVVTRAEKQSKECTSAKNVTENKLIESKSGKDSGAKKGRSDNGKSRNEQSSSYGDRREEKRPSRGKSERRGKDTDECEISIEIG